MSLKKKLFEIAKDIKVPEALEVIIWADASKYTNVDLQNRDKIEKYLTIVSSYGCVLDSTREAILLLTETSTSNECDFIVIPRKQVLRRIFYTEAIELPDDFFLPPKKK